MARENILSKKFSFDLYVPAEKLDLADVNMVHGLSDCRRTWKYVAQTIADGTHRNVYAIDARNHGSSIWSDECSYEIMSQDMTEFMEQCNINNAAFVGHCMGGLIVMLFALSEPRKVCSLIVEGGSPAPLPTSFMEKAAKIIDIRKKCLQLIPPRTEFLAAKNIVLEAHRHAFKKVEIAFPPEFYDDALVHNNDQYMWNFNINALKEIIITQREIPFTGSYEKPSLFIYGEKSSINVSLDKDLILKYFPKAVLSKFEESEHNVHVDNPKRFSQEVIDFLNE